MGVVWALTVLILNKILRNTATRVATNVYVIVIIMYVCGWPKEKYSLTYLVSTNRIMLHLSAQAADIIVVWAPESMNAFTGNLKLQCVFYNKKAAGCHGVDILLSQLEASYIYKNLMNDLIILSTVKEQCKIAWFTNPLTWQLMYNITTVPNVSGLYSIAASMLASIFFCLISSAIILWASVSKGSEFIILILCCCRSVLAAICSLSTEAKVSEKCILWVYHQLEGKQRLTKSFELRKEQCAYQDCHSGGHLLVLDCFV